MIVYSSFSFINIDCLFFTSLIMNGEKLQLEPFFATCGKKGLSAKAAAKEIYNVKDSGTVYTHVAQNWFRHLKEGEDSLKDKPRSGRPSVVGDETLLEMVE